MCFLGKCKGKCKSKNPKCQAKESEHDLDDEKRRVEDTNDTNKQDQKIDEDLTTENQE